MRHAPFNGVLTALAAVLLFDINIGDMLVRFESDAAALEAVYQSLAGPLYTLLRRLVRRPAIAEELLQETFVDVIEHIGAYEARCPLPAGA